MFVPLNFLLFMKIFFLVLYLVNLIIIARPFLRALFLLPIRFVRSISHGRVSSPRCSLIILIDKVSVSSFRFSSKPCIRRQSRLKYCSCSSTCTKRLLTYFYLLYFFFCRKIQRILHRYESKINNQI